MRAEQMLDHAIMHLVEQGDRSMANGKCMYNASNGRHCAIGWLAPDAPFRENLPASENLVLLQQRGIISENQYFSEDFSDWIDSVQRAHDWTDTDFQASIKMKLESFRNSARHIDKQLGEL